MPLCTFLESPRGVLVSVAAAAAAAATFSLLLAVPGVFAAANDDFPFATDLSTLSLGVWSRPYNCAYAQPVVLVEVDTKYMAVFILVNFPHASPRNCENQPISFELSDESSPMPRGLTFIRANGTVLGRVQNPETVGSGLIYFVTPVNDVGPGAEFNFTLASADVGTRITKCAYESFPDPMALVDLPSSGEGTPLRAPLIRWIVQRPIDRFLVPRRCEGSPVMRYVVTLASESPTTRSSSRALTLLRSLGLVFNENTGGLEGRPIRLLTPPQFFKVIPFDSFDTNGSAIAFALAIEADSTPKRCVYPYTNAVMHDFRLHERVDKKDHMPTCMPPASAFTILPTYFPTGLAFDNKTGAFFGTPQDLYDGRFNYSITPLDPFGVNGDTFTLSVGIVDNVPVNCTYGLVNNTFSLLVDASSAVPPITLAIRPGSCSVEPSYLDIGPYRLPAGLTFDRKTGMIRGKPTEIFVQPVTYTVTPKTVYHSAGTEMLLTLDMTEKAIVGCAYNTTYLAMETGVEYRIQPERCTPKPFFFDAVISSPSSRTQLPAGVGFLSLSGAFGGYPSESTDGQNVTLTITPYTQFNTSGAPFDLTFSVLDRVPMNCTYVLENTTIPATSIEYVLNEPTDIVAPDGCSHPPYNFSLSSAAFPNVTNSSLLLPPDMLFLEWSGRLGGIPTVARAPIRYTIVPMSAGGQHGSPVYLTIGVQRPRYCKYDTSDIFGAYRAFFSDAQLQTTPTIVFELGKAGNSSAPNNCTTPPSQFELISPAIGSANWPKGVRFDPKTGVFSTDGKHLEEMRKAITITVLPKSVGGDGTAINVTLASLPPQQPCQQTDKVVLMEFYKAALSHKTSMLWKNHTGWRYTDRGSPHSEIDFDPSLDCCQWYGVGCNFRGHVFNLSLSANTLSFRMQEEPTDIDKPRPPSIFAATLGRLPDLTHLYMSNNALIGSLPDDLYHLKNLELLDLSNSQIFSSIPTRFQVPKLQELNLASNQIFGRFPRGIALSPKLKVLDVSFNGYLGEDGSIGEDIAKLQDLEVLNADFCGFTGTISPSVWTLPNLETLNVAGNKFTELGLCTAATAQPARTSSSSSSSGATASASASDASSPRRPLRTINVQDNEMRGPLPACLADRAPLLRNFIGGGNNWASPLPEGFADLKHLEVLSLFSAGINGTIPASLMSLEKLRVLGLGLNNLSGPIPDIGNLHRLEELSLLFNRLNGTVPASLSKLTSLHTLLLHHNELVGVNVTDTDFEMLQNNSMKRYGLGLTCTVGQNLFNCTTLPAWTRKCADGAGLCPQGTSTFL